MEIKTQFIEQSLTVNTYDIDVAGHVNNGVYIRWLEDLRHGLFYKIYPLEKLLKANHYLVITSNEIKYKKQIKLFDKPIGKMILQSHSHGLFIFRTEISLDGQLVFTSTQKCVLINLITNKMFKGNINDLLS